MAKMKAKQRNKLPKKLFGIPSKRKFPLNDQAHVKAAVRLFGRASDADKPALARKILRRAKALGMDSSGWKTVHEWAKKSSTVKEYAVLSEFSHYFNEEEELLFPDEDITIRKAVKDDLDFIVEMEMTTFSDKTKSLYPGIRKYCERDAKKYLNDTEIIMDEDERIGIYMAYMDGDVWFISSIALLPEYQNKGIGSALIEHDIDTHDRIQLYVDIYNDKAKKLYERLGFRVIEHDDDHWIMELDKTNDVKLIDATNDDIDYIYECEMETLPSDEKNNPKFEDEVKKDAVDSVDVTKIITLNGKRVGIYQAYPTNKWGLKEGDRDWWYIAEIYLSPDVRGKGIGTSLIQSDISNHDKLLLNVYKENKKAIKLYKRLGFEIDKELDNRYVMRLVKNGVVQESFVQSNVDITVSFIKEVIKKIHDKTKKDSKPPTGNQNCQLCTWCLEAQCRGIDALPRAIYSPRDKALDIKGETIVINPVKIQIKDKADVLSKVKEAGDNARFWVHVNWKDSKGGHEFMLMNIESKVYIVDAQQNLMIEFGSKENDYFDDINYSNSYIVRLDNKKLNETLLKEATDESNILPWNEEKDTEYMRKEGMLGENEHIHEYYDEDVVFETVNVGQMNPEQKARHEARKMDKTALRNAEKIGYDKNKSKQETELYSHLFGGQNTVKRKQIMPGDFKKGKKIGTGSTIDASGREHDYTAIIGSTDQVTPSVHEPSELVIKRDTLYGKTDFDATHQHEVGHMTQYGHGLYGDAEKKSMGLAEDYAFKCAQWFVKKYESKLNTHDLDPIELHADYLAARKVGFKREYSHIMQLGANAKKAHNNSNNKDFYNDEYIRNFINKTTGHEVDELIAFDWIRKKFGIDVDLVEYFRNSAYRDMIKKKIPVSLIDVLDETVLPEFYASTRDKRRYTQTLTSSYEYRALFIQDMMWLHKGRPDRCSMKYPAWTPEVKKAFMEFCIDEDEEHAKKTGLITEAAANMIKVDYFKFDKVYYGAIHSGGKHRELTSPLFVTPFIGIASIFAGREKLIPELRKRGVIGEYNLKYKEWELPTNELHKIFKTVHVIIEVPSDNKDCKTDVEPFTIPLVGYIHTINVSKYKSDIYQYEWMDKTNEYLISAPEVDIAKVERTTINYVVKVEKMDPERERKWREHHKPKWKEEHHGQKPVQEQFIEESYRDEHFNKLYFHISPQSHLDGQVFKPRVPEYLDRYDPNDKNFENDTTPRISLSPSIEGCLNAIMVNMPRINVLPKTQFYVYIPEKPFKDYKHKTNKELIRDKDIFDASVTQEVWILEPVRMKLYGVIQIDQVKNVKRKQNVPTASGEESTRPYYDYKWHWLVKPKVLEKGSRFDYSIPKVVENLSYELSKFRYGLNRDGRLMKDTTDKDFDKYWRLSSPEEFDQAGGGNCFDFVEYEAGYLDTYGIPCTKYYIFAKYKQTVRFHTFVVVKDNDKFIYIEAAFKRVVDEMGYHKTFDSLKEILDYVLECMVEYDNVPEFNYAIFDYTDCTPSFGTDMKHYTQYIVDNGEEVDDGTIENKSKRKKDD